MLAALSAISSIKKVLSFLKEHRNGLFICGIIVALFFAWGAWSKYKEAKAELREFREDAVINLRASRNASEKQILRVQSAAEREIALRDSAILAYKDSLGIRDKQITKLRRMGFGKTTTKVITEYDTVYELLEVAGNVPTRFVVDHDNCIKLKGEFTPEGLKTSIERNISVFDISYWERRRLFGWVWTPRLGKKQYYQTLITNCGDTITKNEQITFEH